MPVRKRSLTRRALTHAEAFELLIGPHQDYSEFMDDSERRALWLMHRESLSGDCRAGSRPWGWWRYEAAMHRPPWPDEQPTALRALGELSDREERELARWATRLPASQATPGASRDSNSGTGPAN